MRKATILLTALLVVAFMGGSAYALSITATASGSPNPDTATHPDTVTNGDFTILGNNTHKLVGNGVDEDTVWDFDFTGDTNFGAFPTNVPLASAMFSLTLNPKNALITTDAVKIEGLSGITDPIQGLSVNTPSTVEFDLLDYYSSADILGAFTGGQISMRYTDDAILSGASLELTPTPEPGTIVLLLTGLVGLVGARKKFMK